MRDVEAICGVLIRIELWAEAWMPLARHEKAGILLASIVASRFSAATG